VGGQTGIAERERGPEARPYLGAARVRSFPELAAEGRLHAYRHEGLWLTVNTPKDLRRAEDHLAANPSWLSPL